MARCKVIDIRPRFQLVQFTLSGPALIRRINFRLRIRTPHRM